MFIFDHTHICQHEQFRKYIERFLLIIIIIIDSNGDMFLLDIK